MSYKSLVTDEFRHSSSVSEHCDYYPKYYSPTLRFNRHRFYSPTRLYYPRSYHTQLTHAPLFHRPLVHTPLYHEHEVKIERIPLQRSNSYVSVVESKNETRDNDNYDYKYDYNYVEETDNKSIKRSHSKSMSNISKSMSCISNDFCAPVVKPVVNSVTYVYDRDLDDKHRHVTYVKHSTDDSASLAGNLVKNSEKFLPVNRSVNVGPIFNGNSFGILSEHLTIRDTFNVAFQFKTTAQNGVLMIIVDRSTKDSFFIELYDSQLKATLFVDGEADSCWTDFSKPVLSNDIWSDVEVKIINNKMTMTVRNEHFHKTHRFPFRRPIRGDLFVAGYPSTSTPPFVCRSKDFFVGEMRNFFLNNDGVKWYGTPSCGYPRLRNWY